VKHLYKETKVLIKVMANLSNNKNDISIDIKKNTTYDAGNAGPGFVQVQQCDVTKPVFILKYKYNI
jgi:hypothetical protein